MKNIQGKTSVFSIILSIILIGSFIGFGVYSVQETQLIFTASHSSDPKVAAFYYGWYSNTTNFSQSAPSHINDDTVWRHWDANGYEPPVNACSTFTPESGWYDCADPVIIEKHLRQAEWAGIDSFVVSYWGYSGFELMNFQNMLRVAQEIGSNLTFSLYFEIFMNGLDNLPDTDAIAFLSDQLSVIYSLLIDPNYTDLIWMKNDKPVLFSYVVQAISANIWTTTLSDLNEDDIEFFLVADRPGSSEDYNQNFQGVHQYDVYAPTRDGTYLADFFDFKRSSSKFGQIFCAGVSPGYNDTKVRDGNIPFSRQDGNFYETSWEQALSLNPDWITITSWNEWHEGTEIEPSLENEDLALNQTKEFITKFKTGGFGYQSFLILYGLQWLDWVIGFLIVLGLDIGFKVFLVIKRKRKYAKMFE